jgi:hypothetical protein
MSKVENISQRGPTVERPPASGPRCPICAEQPAQLRASQTQFGNMLAAVFSCGNCGAILSVAPVGMVEPEKPRIVVPGGGI